MKKVLVFFLICLSSTVMFAQDKLHWTPEAIGNIGMTMTCTSVLQIDGELQKNPNLEIGVFSNDGKCRGANLPLYRSKNDQWIYLLLIQGAEGWTYTLKVYDHESNQELALTLQEAPIAFEANAMIGNIKEPYVLNFTSDKKDDK